MNSIRRLVTSALTVAALLIAPPASAQIVDSFFDIDFGPAQQRETCDPCQAIVDEIAFVKGQIATLEMELNLLSGLMESTEESVANAKEDLKQMEAELQELQNPQNYVESEGRRYDSADHAAMQRRSQNLWDDYKAGDLTAQQYSDELSKPFDDPAVQKELDKLKKELQKEKAEAIKELKEILEAVEDQLEEWDELGKEDMAKLDSLQLELEQLEAALESCRSLCELAPSLDGIMSLPVPDPGVLGGLFDFIGGLFGGPPQILPPLPEPQPVLPDLPDLSLPEFPPILPLAPEDGVPPGPCRACDPIRLEIAKLEISLQEMKLDKQNLEAQVDAWYEQKSTLNDLKNQLEENLESLTNPTEYAESVGRRLDGADRVAMEIRNTRLWSEYRSGNLTAQELEAEWEKPFDDPDVAKELQDIKDQLQEEIEDTLERLEESLEDIDQDIEALNDEIIALAGRIGGGEKLLEFLRKDLEDCIKRCTEVETVDTVLGEDLEKALQQIVTQIKEFDFSAMVEAEVTESTSSSVASDDDDEFDDTVVGDFALPYMCCDQSPSEDCEPCEQEEDEDEDEDEEKDLEVMMDPVEFEPRGYFCSVPVLRNLTCGQQNDDEDDMDDLDEIDEDDAEDIDDLVAVNDGGFFCNSFGWFCPKPNYMLSDITSCFSETPSSICDELGQEGEDPQFFLEGPTGSRFPLLITGFDGNDSFGPNDIIGLNDCIQNGPGSCSGLNFNLPDNGSLFTDGFETGSAQGFGLGVRGPGGNDILLGDPLNTDLINIGGGGNDILNGNGFPDDLIGPGNDTIIGGPPGLDLFGENGDDLIGDPPPPPTESQPNMQNDPQVQQVVQAAVQKYLQGNPLKECEKLRVQVSRVRIGNRVRYTVRITRIRDESLCPKNDCPQFQYPSADLCTANCPSASASRCVVDERTGCFTCEEACNGAAGLYEQKLTCDANCPSASGGTCALNDAGCYYCEPGDTAQCEKDLDCDDGDSCTFDTCLEGACLHEYNPECDESICEDADPCKSDSQCASDQFCDADGCCTLLDDTPVKCSYSNSCSSDDNCAQNQFCDASGCCAFKPVTCPDIAHDSSAACEQVCTGTCRAMTDYGGCFICQPDDYSRSSVPPKLECDAPYKQEGACRSSCDGQCVKAYTRTDNVKCYECKEYEPVCGDGTVDAGEQCDDGNTSNGDGCDAKCQMEDIEPVCGDGTVDAGEQCDDGNTSNGDGCDAECQMEPIDDEPSCPSGTADRSTCESQCSGQGGTCVDEGAGCFSCVVVNCPDGSYKDECPSSCGNGCEVVGEQYGVSCYQCKQSCEDVCASNGYGGPETDHSSAILSELNGYSCVSGANISIQTATIGSCQCIGEYSLSVNDTPPVCTGTPCGDVTCGSSATCQEGDTTITVNCNWGGWEKIQKHQFRPVVGN